MAVRAIARLRVMLALLKVTDEAGALGHGYVFSLDNLRMAACAAEAFATLQVREVNFMVEDNFFEFLPALKKPFIMTSLTKAGFVRNLGPWL